MWVAFQGSGDLSNLDEGAVGPDPLLNGGVVHHVALGRLYEALAAHRS